MRHANSQKLFAEAVGLYILLLNLTEKGMQQIRTMTRMVSEAKAIVGEHGAKLNAAYAVLGRYDIVAVVEAPDNKTIARVSA